MTHGYAGLNENHVRVFKGPLLQHNDDDEMALMCRINLLVVIQHYPLPYINCAIDYNNTSIVTSPNSSSKHIPKVTDHTTNPSFKFLKMKVYYSSALALLGSAAAFAPAAKQPITSEFAIFKIMYNFEPIESRNDHAV